MFKKVKGYQLSSEIVLNKDLLTKATERAKKIHGTEKHKDVARCYKMWGYFFLKFSMDEEAEEALNKSMKIYQELYGVENLKVANIYKNLAKVYA